MKGAKILTIALILINIELILGHFCGSDKLKTKAFEFQRN